MSYKLHLKKLAVAFLCLFAVFTAAAQDINYARSIVKKLASAVDM
jgi:hypothetical protein